MPAENVELLDEAGERLQEADFEANQGDMKIQTFIFGLDAEDPTEEEEDGWPEPPLLEDINEEDYDPKASKFNTPGRDKSLEGLANECDTTCASSEQADSPYASLPLHEAVTLGNCDAVAQLLADGADVGKRDGDGESALHMAAYHNRLDMVNVLLGAKADPNALDRKGKTPLRRAYDSPDVAAALLAAGADPNAADKNGNTALHRAAEDDHVDVAGPLLAASANPNLLNDDDLSPLHTAAIFGKAHIAKLLLGAGAEVDSKGCGGNTALHFAAYGGCQQVGKVLLEAGADRAVRNEDGETPMEHANTGDHKEPAWLAA